MMNNHIFYIGPKLQTRVVALSDALQRVYLKHDFSVNKYIPTPLQVQSAGLWHRVYLYGENGLTGVKLFVYLGRCWIIDDTDFVGTKGVTYDKIDKLYADLLSKGVDLHKFTRILISMDYLVVSTTESCRNYKLDIVDYISVTVGRFWIEVYVNILDELRDKFYCSARYRFTITSNEVDMLPLVRVTT